MGRFISEDPIRDGMNWFVYCGNNPIIFFDPSGKEMEGDKKEFGENSDTYKILVDLGKRWWNADEARRKQLSNTANEVRRLAREGTPILFAEDKVMNELYKNADTASVYTNLPYARRVAMLIDNAYGVWNYKENSDWQVPYSKFNGKDMNVDNNKNWHAWMYFDGMLMAADDFGNLNMAYIGSKLGLSNWVYQNFATTDGKDAFWIQYGIDMDKEGK